MVGRRNSRCGVIIVDACAECRVQRRENGRRVKEERSGAGTNDKQGALKPFNPLSNVGSLDKFLYF
jgi:hypothetical protein